MSDAADLLDWIRHRPLAHFENGMLMVHAGVLPQWDAAMTMELATFQRTADTRRAAPTPGCWCPQK